MRTSIRTQSEDSLLSKINDRNTEAFGDLYLLVFDELHYFAAKLYKDTEIDAGDAVQDVFLALFQSPNRNFPNIVAIKAYLFISIRNNFKKYIRSNSYKSKFLDYSRNETDKFQADMFEAGMFSLFHQALGMLPDETAEIFQLFFMGWSVEEIAEKMGKSKQTIYNIRSQALAMLRQKLPEDLLYTLIIYLTVKEFL